MRALANAFFRERADATTSGPIGIDFSLDFVHLVQLESAAGRPPALRARASLPFDGPRNEVLENPSRFRALLRRALGSGPFLGRRAVVAIPSSMFRTVSVNFRMNGAARDEADAVLRVMSDRLDGELQDYVIDYMPVKSLSKTDERLALVAVSDKAAIVDFLESFRTAGIDVDALEIGPVAISRLVGRLAAGRGNANVLVINTGTRASYLTLISGTDLLFDREVVFGENSLVQQAADALDMPADMIRDHLARSGVASSGSGDVEFGSTMAEILKPRFLKLVDEIKRVCMYAAAETRGGAVSQVYLLGSIARWPGSAALLSSLTGVDVRNIPDPLALLSEPGPVHESGAGEPAPEIAVATGAALRGIRPHA